MRQIDRQAASNEFSERAFTHFAGTPNHSEQNSRAEMGRNHLNQEGAQTELN
jgi:hypothetical protein